MCIATTRIRRSLFVPCRFGPESRVQYHVLQWVYFSIPICLAFSRFALLSFLVFRWEEEEEEAKTESKGWRMEVLEEKVLARLDRDRRFLNYSTPRR